MLIKNTIMIWRRFKVSCTLAVAGLAIAYSIFYMVIVQTHYDLSFDRNFEKADSIFLYSRIISEINDIFDCPGKWSTTTNTAEPRECFNRYSEIKNFCYLVNWDRKLEIKDEKTGASYFINGSVTYASIGFIDIFKPKILYGDVNQAFVTGFAMLTESVAKKIFGDKYPIGEIITSFDYWNFEYKLTVVAVCADFPENCSLKNGVYTLQPESEYLNTWNFTTYFEIDPANVNQLLIKMNEEQYIAKQSTWGASEDWLFGLTVLPKIHLWFPEKGEGNPVTVIALLALGILLLVVSYINFLNFAVAMAPVRVKSINIRKVLGENSFMLKFSIIIEAIFLSFIAFLFSIFLIEFLSTGTLQNFFIADLTVLKNIDLLIFAGTFSILSGFFAGIYPAFHTTSFNSAMALSGSFSLSMQSKWLKNISTSVQFIAALFLIITTLFVNIQHNYLRNRDWGIQTENILYFNTKIVAHYGDVLMAELQRNPNIVEVTASHCYPGGGQQGWIRDFEEVDVYLDAWYINSDFFDFFGVNLIEGDYFKEKDFDKIIVNNTFANTYGNNNDVIGKKIINYDINFEIIGIVEDFNYRSMHSAISPLGFILIPDSFKRSYYDWIFVKTHGINTMQTIDFIQDTWKKFSYQPVEVLILTESIKSLYEEEHNLANLVSICGIIAIIVAIIGLYGLILFDSKAKRKNIAIRKVHGASIIEIMLMLNKNLFIRFAISCLIAFPITHYVVQRWLEEFAYVTPFYWSIFALGAIIVLLISILVVSWESYKAASANPAEVIRNE